MKPFSEIEGWNDLPASDREELEAYESSGKLPNAFLQGVLGNNLNAAMSTGSELQVSLMAKYIRVIAEGISMTGRGTFIKVQSYARYKRDQQGRTL